MVSQQARNCFVYERSQHTRSCPEKNQGNCPSSMICLRCGGSGHDMLFCRSEYSSDDLKVCMIFCGLVRLFSYSGWNTSEKSSWKWFWNLVLWEFWMSRKYNVMCARDMAIFAVLISQIYRDKLLATNAATMVTWVL